MIQDKFEQSTKRPLSLPQKSNQKEQTEHRFQLPWVLPFQRPNFYFPRLKFTLTRPPTWVLNFAIFLVIFYVFSGGVYLAVEGVTAPYYVNPDGTVEMVYQRATGKYRCSENIRHQYVYEAFAVGFLIFLALIGLYLIYMASKDPHDPNRAFNYQLSGAILLFIAVLIIENLMAIKGC